jgi:hypothetical protein
VKSCAESVDSGTPGNQSGRGGAIPASALHFRCGNDSEAAALVLRYHYSGRVPQIVLCGTFHKAGGLFGDAGECVAACIFSSPPTQWSIPVLELQRLVRNPDHRVPLSRLISLTCVYVRKRNLADLVVSFADRTAGPHGGVYQAAGWNYHGHRERLMDGVIWNGDFVPGRTCNARWGTRSPDKLRELGIVVDPHYDEGKHLYWRTLTKKGDEQARQLRLQRNAYPKPKARCA